MSSATFNRFHWNNVESRRACCRSISARHYKCSCNCKFRVRWEDHWWSCSAFRWWSFRSPDASSRRHIDCHKRRKSWRPPRAVRPDHDSSATRPNTHFTTNSNSEYIIRGYQIALVNYINILYRQILGIPVIFESNVAYGKSNSANILDIIKQHDLL